MSLPKADSAMSHKFENTINITPDAYNDLLTGALELRFGQWITLNYGRRGQYLGVHNGIVKGSWVERKDTFVGRTQRFCRANWHHNHKAISTSHAVLSAPRTTLLTTVKAAVRRLMGTETV